MVRRNSWSSGGRASAGFTLVELLVVISIIGMLMALLLPAVQAARETGRRNTCQSNQHNLSLALMQYSDLKKSYPGWNNWLSQSAASNQYITSGTYQYAEVTYIVPLLPFLEQNPVYQNYTQYLNTVMANSSNANQLSALGQSQVYLQFLICPSNPPVSTFGATPLAYVINGGQIDSGGVPVPQVGETVYASGNSPSTTIQSVAIASGLAYDQTGFTTYGDAAKTATAAASLGVSVKVSQDYVNTHDGTNYTLLLAENTMASSSWSLLTNGAVGSGPSVNSGYAAAITSGASAPYVQQCSTTFMWANSATGGVSTPPTGYYTINGDKNNTTATDNAHARPASNHTGVCVFAFCGGNVRPISEEIDYRVYKQLMTPFGGQTIGAPSSSNLPSGSGDIDSNTTVISDASF